MKPRRVRSGATLKNQQTNGERCKRTARRSIRGWRRSSRSLLLVFLGEQTELIDTGRANFIDHGDHVALLGASIALNVNGLVKTGRDAILDLSGDIFLAHLSVAEKNAAIASDGHYDGIVLVGVLHLVSVFRGSQVHLMSLLQHGCDHHENNQQDEHDVGHGNNVGGRHLGAGLWLVGHGRLLLRAAAQDKVVDQLHRGVVHLDVEGFHFVGEVVVRPDGRDGHEETKRRGHERFGNTAGHSRETGDLVCGDTFKRVQNAYDRTEQSDERSCRTDGGEGGKATLHFGMDDGDGTFKATFGGINYVGVRNLLGSGLELRKAGGDHLGNVALLVALGNGDGFVKLAVLEGAGNLLHEDTRLLASRAVHQGAIKHHAERIDRKSEQDKDDELYQEGHGRPHAAEVKSGRLLKKECCKSIQGCYHSFAP